MVSGNDDRKSKREPLPVGNPWPIWARVAVSALLGFHLLAILAGALASEPASLLEHGAGDLFGNYYQTIDQGYSYRYYAPEPPPTPVVTARIRYDDGRPEEILRVPQPGIWPRLRYQRQLALANHVTADFERARRLTGQGSQSMWGRSYARHIAHERAGCVTVSLFTRLHLIPDTSHVLQPHDGKPFDLNADEFYTEPELIGDYPCEGR